jgi:polyketide biosynthesis 3-hydroxy-3-methylglutaryl-CoA synthase-like enzyme PksG
MYTDDSTCDGIGLEAINAYVGQASVAVRDIFERRQLDLSRFDNLMMSAKSVGFPWEDPITIAVNAAHPIMQGLSDAERRTIRLLVTATESGVDFGKSISTYIHDCLGMDRRCRLFEIKQACFGGTAALQTAVSFVASSPDPDTRALVIATDCPRAKLKATYVEPSQGLGGVAMLVSRRPEAMEMDPGAFGCCSFEVMDTCRPVPELELGDPDLSLFSYLDCLASSFSAYQEAVADADFMDTFDLLAFHTPFPGMVKGAHRHLLRKLKIADPSRIESDFSRRLLPSLRYCTEVGNIYSAGLYLALCGAMDQAVLTRPLRIGLFSYGSGCASEFFSAVITPRSQQLVRETALGERIANRHRLPWGEYEKVTDANMGWTFGLKDKVMSRDGLDALYERLFENRRLLTLKCINNFHREYAWS